MPRTNVAAATAPEVEETSQVTAAPATTDAIPARHRKNVTPVRSRRHDLNAEEHVGKARTRNMRSTGPAREALDPPLVEPVEQVSRAKLEALRFNEDVLTIVVHDSTHANDEPYPEVFNDGVVQRFQRGIEMQVKRKYVEVLARAKRKTLGNQRYRDAEGNEAYRYPAHSALRYPFSVIHDPAGRKGDDWLKLILKQPE